MSSREEQARVVELRDTVPPSRCYDICNNANLEAQSAGMTPELCSADSSFQDYYEACNTCVNLNTGDADEPTKEYLDSTFSQYLDYCDTIGNSTTVTGSPPATPSVAATFLVTISVTTTIDGSTTVWPFTKTLTSYVPLPYTTIVSVTTSENGHRTIWTFVKTLTPLSSGLFENSSRTTSSITTQQTSQVSESMPTNPTDATTSTDSQSSRAWIAGPVIGAITGAAILLIATWFMFRLIKRRNNTKGQELHGESTLVSELDHKIKPQELHGKGENTHPVELPGSAF